MTNFNISVYNPYCFILLHLRNKGHKNPMNLYIPEVCIFHDRTPYDIVHNSKGYIRGTRNADDRKLRMKDMQRVFKDASAHDLFPKNEQIVAAFACTIMLTQKSRCWWFRIMICSWSCIRPVKTHFSRS